jgi:glycine dehydrogenase
MLEVLGLSSLDELIDKAVPASIRLSRPIEVGEGSDEHSVLKTLGEIASLNRVFRSFIGMGYHACVTPAVIRRGIFENPGWYTQYTPYQPEISQGRLEALLNFQTMVADLTGLEIANASLLDEATAAAEAMHMSYGLCQKEANVYFVSKACHPQTIDVVKTRARAQGVEVLVGDHEVFDFARPVFGALLQYPATDGALYDYAPFVERAHGAGAIVTIAADLLSLVLLKTPGEFGADIAVGNTQRFGVPLGYGGPHAAYFATRDAYKRNMPGRLVGVTKDSRGKPALRLSLQTREQHIRREKATSNICTAQVLLAVMAGMYAVYHGPAGLRNIAQRIHRRTVALAEGLRELGWKVGPESFFDTLRVQAGRTQARILKAALARGINLRPLDNGALGISLDETATVDDLKDLCAVFSAKGGPSVDIEKLAGTAQPSFGEKFARKSTFLTHPVFSRYHSETEMLRYIHRLQNRDLSLDTAMIPLGSCTMKLNAAVEMLPVSWPEFGQLHPFARYRFNPTQGPRVNIPDCW